MVGADPTDRRLPLGCRAATPEMQQVISDARIERAKMEQSASVVQRNIPDLPIMLLLAVSSECQRMVPWLLNL